MLYKNIIERADLATRSGLSADWSAPTSRFVSSKHNFLHQLYESPSYKEKMLLTYRDNDFPSWQSHFKNILSISATLFRT